MPPASMNKVLTAREVALLRRWIEQGAEYKRHWAFLPPEIAESTARQESPIDYFIDAKIHEEGLRPAPPVAREALLRRTSYVLTGLPPAAELVREFTEDDSAGAFEKVVDDLLDSPRFGERWARHWLDLVRYAEAKGHEFDYSIDGAWVYRDYLIRAFNNDVPYDQLVAEHLAGDLLPLPRLHEAEGFNESVIGTSYFYLGEGKHSPVDTRIDEAERIDNIIDVTTKTFQAMTVACARCHDHKFDPIPTTDYYALYGIVESARFAATPLISALYQGSLDSMRALRQDLRRQVALGWSRELAGRVPVQPVRQGTKFQRPEGPKDHRPAFVDTSESAFALGDFRRGTYDGWYPHGPGLGEMPAVGIPVLRSGSLDSLSLGYITSQEVSSGIPAALRSPTFIIGHDSILVQAAGYKSSIRIVIDNLQMIQAPIHGGLLKTMDTATLSPYRFGVEMWKGRKAYVELVAGTFGGRQHITENHLLLRHDSSYFDVAYAVVYNEAPPDLSPAWDDPRDEDVMRAVRNWASGAASPAQVAAVNRAVRMGQLTRPDLAKSFERVNAMGDRLHPVTYHIGLTDGNAVHSAVFERGNSRTLVGAPVPHRFLTVLDTTTTPFTASSSGRLDLARAIVDPSNPLTARVMVNRLWHHVFGRGIVRTVDNFGAQGALPTHPELLDYLAVRFVDLDYSIKAMLREIVLSRAFRRSTENGGANSDPDNLLLSHYSVRRLEAEAIRDGLLAVSGRLDTTMYGPPVHIHLTEYMEGRGRPAESGPLDGAGRRSIYIAVRRNFLSPMMLAFDRPIPFSTFGARNTSNVPAQSLIMLNDPLVAEQARVWARNLVAMPGLDTDRRIEYIHMRALSRMPTEEEVAQARQFISAEALRLDLPLAVATLDADVWAAYCHVIFNLKEFIYLV